MFTKRLPFVLCLLASRACRARDYYEPWTALFEHYSYVDGADRFALYWNTPRNDERIEIGIACQALGYCSFGVSVEGTMLEADITVGWVDDDGIGHLEQRFTDSVREEPRYQRNQDEIELDEVFVEGNWTFFRFTRMLYPCNAGAQPIPLGTARTIYAWSENKPVPNARNAEEYNLAYHGNNRGSESVNLQTGDSVLVEMPPDAAYVDVQVTDYEIPSEHTVLIYMRTVSPVLLILCDFDRPTIASCTNCLRTPSCLSTI